jgi:hypothetical protein
MIRTITTDRKILNRRTRRSVNVTRALTLQLDAAAERAAFDTLVLGDELGMVMAHSGKASIGEQLAALSPLLAPDKSPWHGRVKTAKGELFVSVAPIRVGENRLYLSATGGHGQTVPRELFKSGLGVARILG